jgi:hypothetical protein
MGDGVVRFLGVPVAAYLNLQEWIDAVIRECELIAALEQTPPHLPARLLELAAHLSERFAIEQESFRETMAQACTAGLKVVDLEDRVLRPREEAVQAADAFLAMMEELDEFCRTDILLSEPPDPVVVDLRRWFVTEMRDQLIAGATPISFRATV